MITIFKKLFKITNGIKYINIFKYRVWLWYASTINWIKFWFFINKNTISIYTYYFTK